MEVNFTPNDAVYAFLTSIRNWGSLELHKESALEGKLDLFLLFFFFVYLFFFKDPISLLH